MNDTEQIPLFPLNTVLFPNGYLPLRIFEARYLDMISACMRTDTGFGVIPIQRGVETGTAPEIYAFGTLARIIDWDQGADGLLNITTRGGKRFRVIQRSVSKDELSLARVQWLPVLEHTPVPAVYGYLLDLLEEITGQIADPKIRSSSGGADTAPEIVYRLAAILPLPLEAKTELLGLDDPLEQLHRLDSQVRRLQQSTE